MEILLEKWSGFLMFFIFLDYNLDIYCKEEKEKSQNIS